MNIEYLIKTVDPQNQQKLYKKIIETVPVGPSRAELPFEDSRIENPSIEIESLERYIKACDDLGITPFYYAEICVGSFNTDVNAQLLVPSCMDITPNQNESLMKSLLGGGKPCSMLFRIINKEGYQKFQTTIWPLIAENSRLTTGAFLDFNYFEGLTPAAFLDFNYFEDMAHATLKLPSLNHPNHDAYLNIYRNDKLNTDLNKDKISALEKWVEDFQQNNFAIVTKLE